MEFTCPLPNALTTVPNAACPENLGQIQKFIFQRAIAAWVFDSTGGTSFLEAASWTPLIVAAGNTKIVISPYLDTVVIPKSEAITIGGGDNSTLNGRQLVAAGTNPIITGEERSASAEIIAAMQKLSQGEDLVWYAINQFNQLIGRDAYPGHPGTNIVGIPCHALFQGDAGNEGFAKDDKAQLRFGVDYGWRQNIYIKKPNFNAKAVLVAANET